MSLRLHHHSCSSRALSLCWHLPRQKRRVRRCSAPSSARPGAGMLSAPHLAPTAGHSRMDWAPDSTCQTMKARLAVEKSSRGTLYLVTNRRTGPHRSRTACRAEGGRRGWVAGDARGLHIRRTFKGSMRTSTDASMSARRTQRGGRQPAPAAPTLLTPQHQRQRFQRQAAHHHPLPATETAPAAFAAARRNQRNEVTHPPCR